MKICKRRGRRYFKMLRLTERKMEMKSIEGARDEEWGRGLVCGILFGFKFGLIWAGDILKYILEFYKLTFRLPFRLYGISFGRERKKEGKERLNSSRHKSARVS